MKLSVIGDKDSIQGFLALGLNVFPVSTADEAREILKAQEDCAIIYITENIAEGMMDEIDRCSEAKTPAVILIPNSSGTLGIGMSGVKKSVERAVGADILFGQDN